MTVWNESVTHEWFHSSWKFQVKILEDTRRISTVVLCLPFILWAEWNFKFGSSSRQIHLFSVLLFMNNETV